MATEGRPRAREVRLSRPSTSRDLPWWWPGWPSLRDVVTSVLALAIVAYTGAALWIPLTTGTQEGSQHAQAIMALLGPILGAVIGYYFGTTSGERVAQQATRRVEEAIEDKLEAEQQSADTLAQLESTRPILEQSAEDLEYFLSRTRTGEPTEERDGDRDTSEQGREG